MSELHVCPYCHTVYRYKDIIMLKGKTHECYHCHKSFEVNRILKYIPVPVISIVLIMMNVLILKNSENISTGSFMILALADAVSILIAYVLSPFLIRFRKMAKKKKSEKK